MSDRYNSLVVSLERDIKTDDAETIINAIKAIRGVVGVTGNVVDFDSYAAYSRVGLEWSEKLLELIREMNRKQ